ncbi:MAG: c-type cytochrome [Saprospiraceae bacterium]
MKKIWIFLVAVMAFYACGGNATDDGEKIDLSKPVKKEAKAPADNKGIGEVKNVSLNNPLNVEMVERGKAIYEMKCASCHKLSGQKVVGPGWAGVTERRTPEWIMNMTTNVEVMLEQDPAAQEMLKECLVRMPNQNLSLGDARDVLEFMFENDSKRSEK